jgi:predicted nucleotidyltransferase
MGGRNKSGHGGSKIVPSSAEPLYSCSKKLNPRTATDDKVLRGFRAALNELYGDRSERVVLFGSRARGDAHEASDYDIAVFLKDLTDRWREFHRLADLRTEILADTGVFIEARPFPAGGYRERTPLMDEIRSEGVDF